MSELTQCNYCSYQNYLRQARKDKMKVTVLPEDFGLGGVAVYVYPRGVNIKKLTPTQRKKYHRSWFMELGSRCVC